MAILKKMKRAAFACLFLACLSRAASAQDTASLHEGDRVAICGDSITEQRAYSVYIEDYLLMCQPAPKLEAYQFGWSGEVSWGFVARMKNDVLPFQPTVATTCYGMNDGGYGPAKPEVLQKYHDAMLTIIKTFKEAGVRFIIVGSPGVVDADTYRRGPDQNVAVVYNKTLGELGDVGKQIAAEQGVTFADVHGVMLDAMTKAKAKYGPTYAVAGGDGVHPSSNGHLIMAYAFLKAMGCNGDIGTITVNLKTNAAQATEGHKVISSANGSVEIESSRYPFCFTGDPAKPDATSGIIEFFPFNQDLNRFRLVVTNAGAEKLRVTWGKESKEFAAADLERGINLSAEFLVNPFGPAFAKADAAIRQQQAFETPAVKSLLHTLPEWSSILPEEKATLDRLAQSLVKKDQPLREAARAAIVPMKHVIKIEPIK